MKKMKALHYLLTLIMLVYTNIALAQSENTRSIWANTTLFDDKQRPANLNQEQYNQLFNKLFYSEEIWIEPIEMKKTIESSNGTQNEQVETVKNCAAYEALKNKGYEISTPAYSDNYTGSGVYPDELAQCNMLILMKNLKVARTSYLDDFKLNEAGLRQLPATLATTFTDAGQRELNLEAQQGKSLQQAEDISPEKTLSSSNEINSFADEIQFDETYYPRLVLEQQIIDKLKAALEKDKNAANSADGTVKIFNHYVTTPIPKVKIFQNKCIYVGDMSNADWPGTNQKCIALYFPGDEMLGFVEVARGDFTGNGQEDVLLWRYLDITPAGGQGPSLGDTIFLLTRDKPGTMLKVIKRID